MTKMEKPNKPCYACGSNAWWQRPDSGWSCGQCYPNPNPAFSPVATIVVEGYNPELLALRDRVKGGNDKLFRAWLQVMEITDSEEQSEQEARWEKARDKLNYLCLELQTKGYEDCLYVEDGKKMKPCPQGIECLVCPSTKPYWRDEK